jgi:NAD(P)-dependent dehydrogenase (short-subunit alcohol dehydrogenase family)
MNSLSQGYRALVLGASGAIGAAFVAALQADPRCAEVLAVSRQSHPGWDITDEASMAALAQSIIGPLHVVVDATGALTVAGVGPEKRLADLSADRLMRSWRLNAMGPALAIQHLSPKLVTHERAIWAKLSARVGSIEDNHKGGWYAYRSAKAALNQLLQTSAIELARQRPGLVVAALQPGTVASSLSQPFVGEHAMAAEESVQRLLEVLDALPATGRAHFVDHAGQVVPW